MFDINFVIQRLSDQFSPEIVNKSIQGLVNKGILEQYTDEDGNFQFELTKFGNECAEELISDPMGFFADTNKPEEEDEMVD